MVVFTQTPGTGRLGPRVTHAHTLLLTPACEHRRGEAEATSLRHPGIYPIAAQRALQCQGKVPPCSGRTLLDRHGRGKAGKCLCQGEGNAS